jgi:hypothetical protein
MVESCVKHHTLSHQYPIHSLFITQNKMFRTISLCILHFQQFQLYRGGQFYWWRKAEKTLTCCNSQKNLYHIILYRVDLSMNRIRTHNISGESMLLFLGDPCCSYWWDPRCSSWGSMFLLLVGSMLLLFVGSMVLLLRGSTLLSRPFHE